MRIGVSINGILRKFLEKLEITYKKYQEDFIDEFVPSIKSYDIENELQFDSFEDLINFVFEEHALEIFGHAGGDTQSMVHLNKLNDEIRDEFQLYLTSREFGKAIAGSCFFLSKTSCAIENIKFVRSYAEKWDFFDVIVTDNELLASKKPEGKICIGVNNDKINGDINIANIKELTFELLLSLKK